MGNAGVHWKSSPEESELLLPHSHCDGMLFDSLRAGIGSAGRMGERCSSTVNVWPSVSIPRCEDLWKAGVIA